MRLRCFKSLSILERDMNIGYVSDSIINREIETALETLYDICTIIHKDRITRKIKIAYLIFLKTKDSIIFIFVQKCRKYLRQQIK